LSYDIVRLVLRLLGGLDDCSLVKIALVVDIELAECVLQAEDLALIKLGIFPVCNAMLTTVEDGGRRGVGQAGQDVLLQLDDVHVGDVQMGKSAGESDASEKEYTGRQTDCLAQPRCALGQFVPPLVLLTR
jgi:hypothetical protein